MKKRIISVYLLGFVCLVLVAILSAEIFQNISAIDSDKLARTIGYYKYINIIVLLRQSMAKLPNTFYVARMKRMILQNI